MTSKKRIDLHVTVDMFEELRQLARDKDITITTLLKLIIQEYLNDKRGK
jgi:post-segregation antitoxin (ccd killing protein)